MPKISSKLRHIFRPKPREIHEKPSILFYFILAVLIIALLNFALLLPLQVSSVFYEFETMIIRFMKIEITLQTWTFILLIVLVAIFGYYTIPIVTIPSTQDFYIYRWTWEEGEIRYYRTLSGKIIAVHKNLVRKLLFKHMIYGAVYRFPYYNYVTYQTADLEITNAIMHKRLSEKLMDENIMLQEALSKQRVYLSLEDVLELMKAKRGGGESES